MVFRSTWNSVAAKWVIRPIIQQQNEFNTLVVRQISGFEGQIIEQDNLAILNQMAGSTYHRLTMMDTAIWAGPLKWAI